MADEIPANVPAQPAAPAIPAPAPQPEIPTTPRLTVPVSALFDEGDAEPIAKPEAAAPAKPAEPAKPADATVKPDDKAAAPAEPAKPAAPAKEGEPAKPAAAAPAKADEPKVKVGDKEYTVAELEKLISNPPKPAPAAAPAKAEAAPAPAAPAPTKEEVAAQENEWVSNFQKTSQAKVVFSKEEMETVLEGGEPAAKVLSDKVNSAVSRAVLETRQSIYNDLNPYFAAANAAMAPLLEQQVQLEQIATEQIFVQRHAEFSEQLPKAREVATALVAQYPKETAAMSREQFTDEVAAQTDRILQAEYLQFNPQAKNTWREALKAAKTPPAAAAPAAPAAPAVPPVKAPNSNSPAANPVSVNGLSQDQKWHKDTANSLVD